MTFSFGLAARTLSANARTAKHIANRQDAQRRTPVCLIDLLPFRLSNLAGAGGTRGTAHGIIPQVGDAISPSERKPDAVETVRREPDRSTEPLQGQG
jgi:hypothetical protein